MPYSGDVRIASMKGYSGWSFLYENCQRLKREVMSGKEIHILYFGDFDPSGDDMDNRINNAFQEFSLTEYVDFQRIAVLKEHIEEFNLPGKPEDKETNDKLKRDKRTEGFIEKYGELYAVELDALAAIEPDRFRSMIQESVDQFFDEEIREAVLADVENQSATISRLVEKKVKFL